MTEKEIEEFYKQACRECFFRKCNTTEECRHPGNAKCGIEVWGGMVEARISRNIDKVRELARRAAENN